MSQNVSNTKNLMIYIQSISFYKVKKFSELNTEEWELFLPLVSALLFSHPSSKNTECAPLLGLDRHILPVQKKIISLPPDLRCIVDLTLKLPWLFKALNMFVLQNHGSKTNKWWDISYKSALEWKENTITWKYKMGYANKLGILKQTYS